METSGAKLSNSALDVQVGGDHYKKLGSHQPWEVLRSWLTPEEFRGYMKGTAIAYLAREMDKGGMQDIEKATHTLQGLIELLKPSAQSAPQAANDNTPRCACGSLPAGMCRLNAACSNG